MTQDRPAIDDLLLTVRQFLDGLAPNLTGEPKYHAQVSSYLLGICEREIRLGPALAERERERLGTYLGAEGSIEDLRALLCRKIRAGDCDEDWPALLGLVLDETVDKVRIVRPGHLDPIHREGGDAGD